jgi:tetratricopeptide (TPR) repeat protein
MRGCSARTIRQGAANTEFADPGQASRWLDSEWRNIVAAVHHAADRGPRPMAWLLADALRGYLAWSRQTTEWLGIATAAVAAAEAEQDLRASAASHHNLAHVNYALNRYAAAFTHLGRGLTLCRLLNWEEGYLTILSNYGNTSFVLGRTAEAITCLSEALGLSRRLGRED